MNKQLILILLCFFQSLIINASELTLEHYSFQPIYFGNWMPSLQNPKDLKNDIIIAKELLKKHPKSVLLIIGHAGKYFPTEGPENKERLQKISQDRANAIKKELISLGVPKERIVVKAIGNKAAQVIPKLNESYKDFQERAQKDRKADIFFVKDPNEIDKLIQTQLIKIAETE